jgi:hypothetical protein
MKTLLNHISVFPPFIKTLSSFGFETGNGQDGRAGFYASSLKSPSGGYSQSLPQSITYLYLTPSTAYQTTYILKHIEPKPGSLIPFSIRQTGIYQKYHTPTKQSSNILLQTPQTVQKQIFRLVQEASMAGFPEKWGSAHEVLMGGLGGGWREYVGFLEARIGEIVSSEV